MTRKIHSGSSQFVGKGVTATLHTGPGKIRAIIATNETPNTPAVIAIYDNTSAAAPLLFAHYIGAAPLVIFFPVEMPLIFNTACTVNTGASIRANLITEA